jgi:hypothetical protein
MHMSRKITVTIAVLACLASWACSVAATGFFAASQQPAKGPVVQNVQEDRATVTWVTQQKSGELRQLPEGGPLTVQEPVYHRVDVTGLKPGTPYKLSLALYGLDAEVNFATAPKGDADFSFVVWGDTRTRHEVHARVAARVLRENPSFVLHTGDLVANGQSMDDWDKFFEIEKDLLRNVPFYPVLGNHERNTPLFSQYFAFPGGGDGHYYSFDWGAVHIVGLDNNQTGPSEQIKGAFLQYELDWLRDDLARNTRPLIFIFFHQPLYTAVRARRESAAKLAEKMEPFLLSGGVTAVFSGHDHNYQHHLKSGLHHIVTGGGGAPLYDVDPIPGVTLKAAKTENYVRVRVTGSSAKVEAFDIEGKLLDSFELEPRPKTPVPGQ